MGLQSLKNIFIFALTYQALCFIGAGVIMYFEASEASTSTTTTNMTKIKSYLETKLNISINETEVKDISDFLASSSSTAVENSDDVGIGFRSLLKWRYFCEITFSTIGYGNIVPTTANGKIFTMLFATVGIPIHLLLITSIGLAVCDMVKHLRFCFRKYFFKNYEKPQSDTTSSVIMGMLLMLWLGIGGLVSSYLGHWSYLNGFYFAFMTLTTIGYGDFTVDVKSVREAGELVSVYTTVGLAFAAGVTNSVVQALGNKAFKEQTDVNVEDEGVKQHENGSSGVLALNKVDAAKLVDLKMLDDTAKERTSIVK